MTEVLAQSLMLALPVVIGGVLHSIAIKLDVLPVLKMPVHSRWFGTNKTWRGFVIMPLTCVMGCYVARWVEAQSPAAFEVGYQNTYLIAAGLLGGLAYMACELPNSYIKRMAGVRPGMLADGPKRYLFLVADQVDSIIGCLLVAYLFLNITVTVLVATIAIGALLHLLINLLLFQLGLRPRPT